MQPDLRSICAKHGLDTFQADFALHIGQEIALCFDHIMTHGAIAAGSTKDKKFPRDKVLLAGMEVALEATRQFISQQGQEQR
jgi:hypothetical protein